jgi:hypothetical protein
LLKAGVTVSPGDLLALRNDSYAPASDKLAIASCRGSLDVDRKLAKLAVMMGLRPILIDACESSGWEALLAHPELRDCGALVASDATLSLLKAQGTHSTREVLTTPRAILLYACEHNAGNWKAGNFASELTGGALGAPVPIPSSEFTASLSVELPAGCEQLRGLSFALSGMRPTWRVFQMGSGEGADALLRLDHLPLLARCAQAAGDLFLLASGHILDVDEAVFPVEMPPAAYLELLPWLIFLRATFGEACWHNPNPRGCLIIDDPPLKPRYGFLRYDDLLAAMDQGDFATSVAFIPWNHRRSNPQTANLFRSHPERLSLSVHGCDHTAGEFETNDETALRCQSRSALARMLEHHASTGVGFDRVMVFPQGRFSKAALQSLWAEGFLAAVNTVLQAADSRPQELTYRDLLDVALICYGGCPLFSRRYPRDIFPFAFDLFMGKPAFIVQHHGDFRPGYGPTIDFVRALNRQDNNLLWRSPARIIEETALWKRASPREQWVRFYTDSFSFWNDAAATVTCRLQRRLPAAVIPISVRRDGEPLEFTIDNSSLTTELVLAPGEAAHITVHANKEGSIHEVRTSAMHRAGVASRRLLSNLRDNYVARNQWLLTKAEKLKKFLRQQKPKPQYRYQ